MSRATDRQRYRMAAFRQRERLMASRNPNPERITTALDAAGLWGPEVDRACGVEEPTVDLWESGELVPTREQVEALAKLAGVTAGFFYRDSPERAGPMWLCGEDGCEQLGKPAAEPAKPLADVVWLSGPGRLF